MSATIAEPVSVKSEGVSLGHKPDHSPPPQQPVRLRMGATRRLENLAFFARQLYVLVSCGTTVVDALSALMRQTKDQEWRSMLADITARVERGSALSDAMARYPTCFDSICRTLVAAGESTGSLDEMLDRVATLSRQRLKLRRSIVGALVYPTLLLSVATGALVLICVVVLPRFAEMFASLNAPLPVMTKMLMAFADVIRTKWWAVLGGVMLLGFAAKALLATPGGRRGFDSMLINMPKFGTMYCCFAVARIVRLLGVLVTARIPLIEAIELTAGAVDNVHYRELLASAEEAVGRGVPLSTALSESALISASVQEAVRSGEQTGQLGTLLVTMADFLDDDNESLVQSLTTIIEPLLLMILGVVVGFIAVSLFLPLFDLTASV